VAMNMFLLKEYIYILPEYDLYVLYAGCNFKVQTELGLSSMYQNKKNAPINMCLETFNL
jgi:hypothetical protein